MHATSSIPTMPATAVKLSFLRSSKTMLGVDQQYPPVIGAIDHLYNNSIGQCTETRYICSAQITPPAHKFLDG